MGGSGRNIHFGVTAGYGDATATDRSGLGTRANFQTPFVGAYTVFVWGNFAFDILQRWDFYQMSLSNSLAGIVNQGLDARGTSTSAGATYRFDLGNQWFLEGSGGVIAPWCG